MAYSIDKSLSWDGLFRITTDSGALYMIKIRESAPDSGLWTIELTRPSEKGSTSEIFKTMRTISEICQEYINQKQGNNVILFVTGDSDESLKKSNVFSRYMGEDWDYVIDRPQIKISNLRNPNIISTNYFIKATRVRKTITENPSISLNTQIISEIKFCFNCGTPNNNFVFCPSCGTKLKQT